MFYLCCDNDDSLDSATLLKSEKIESLIERIKSNNLVNWTIADNPINYDEDIYILIEK